MFDPPVIASQSKHLSDVLDIVDKVIKILALLIGTAWGYLNYRRGRTFKRRLEPTIIGKTIHAKEVLLLSGIAQVKNVGLSKVIIQQRGTAVEIIAIVSQRAKEKVILGTESVRVCSVFEVHGWIEPGESIEESFIVSVPERSDILAFRLRLRIVSDGIEWNCDSIVDVLGVSKAPGAKSTEPH